MTSVQIKGVKASDSYFKKNFSSESEIIDLSNKKLKGIELNNLKHFKKLKILKLSGNFLVKISLDQLYQSSIEKIDLSDNLLKEISLTPLNTCKSLKSLDISRNHIRKLALNGLSNCQKLEDFHVDSKVQIDWEGSYYDYYEIQSQVASLPNALKRYKTEIINTILVKNNLVLIQGKKTNGGIYTKAFKKNQNITIESENIKEIDLTPLEECDFEYFRIERNSLTEIDLIPIRNSNNLKAISILNNNIIEINLSEIDNFSNLEEIEITSTKIEVLDLSFLKKCGNLESLNLSNNKIKYLDLQGIENCKSLTELVLAHNNLTEIDLTGLERCTQLNELNLSDNKLEEIDLSFSSQNKQLETLDFSRNKLKHIKLNHLQGLSSLNSINFASNKIREIDLKPLKANQSLRTINLHDNLLKEIDIEPLKSCGKIGYLILSNNKISNIDLEPLKNLEIITGLGLSHNSLIEINLHPLKDKKSLEWLELNHNMLEKLDLDPLKNCENLNNIKFGNNKTRFVDITPLEETKIWRSIDESYCEDTVLYWDKSIRSLEKIIPERTKRINQTEFKKFIEKVEEGKKIVAQIKTFDRLQKGKEKLIEILNQFHPKIPVPLSRISELTKLSKLEAENYIEELLRKIPNIGQYLPLERVFIKEIEETLTLDQLDELSIPSNLQVVKEQRCIYCSHQLKQIDDEGPIICLECGKKTLFCEICKGILVEGENIVEIKQCKHVFHKEHILEWINAQGTCPICRKRITKESIQKFAFNSASE